MKIGIRALRARLADYVRLAGTAEEEFEIACHGRVLARLVGPQAGLAPEPIKSDVGSAEDHHQDRQRQFSVSTDTSNELKQLVEAKLREFEQMSPSDLLSAFEQATNVTPHTCLSERDLRMALARIFQIQLWIDRMGAVPRDIANRDLQFWSRLLALSTKDQLTATS